MSTCTDCWNIKMSLSTFTTLLEFCSSAHRAFKIVLTTQAQPNCPHGEL